MDIPFLDCSYNTEVSIRIIWAVSQLDPSLYCWKTILIRAWASLSKENAIVSCAEDSAAVNWSSSRSPFSLALRCAKIEWVPRMRRHGWLPFGNKSGRPLMPSKVTVVSLRVIFLIDGSKTSRTKSSPDGTKVRSNLSKLCSMSEWPLDQFQKMRKQSGKRRTLIGQEYHLHFMHLHPQGMTLVQR